MDWGILLDWGCNGCYSWGNIRHVCGFNMNISFGSDIFMNIRYCLRPGFSILVKSSSRHRGVLLDGGCGDESLGRSGNLVDGSNLVAGGSGVPGSSELSLGSLYLRGISKENLGGTAGHSKSSKNNLKTNKQTLKKNLFITL